jgi:hypothetical protein
MLLVDRVLPNDLTGSLLCKRPLTTAIRIKQRIIKGHGEALDLFLMK